MFQHPDISVITEQLKIINCWVIVWVMYLKAESDIAPSGIYWADEGIKKGWYW